ncbi:uncharacterized protein LOC111020848 [Momordica charantia]|uniref:Uncharacterized protein LOC111020848 n=1 Tax=Momordica charantia TaxID=3673 RepID=A0A6J1DIR6_MOMCH|nr:uncharacterized protein LOC111020848 [Momordica charantia]
MLPLLLALLLLSAFAPIRPVKSHQESGEWRCESDSEIGVVAEFRPGIVTLDGHADDWKDIDGFEFSLLPALDPDDDKEYSGGKMTVKALHDGKDVFFLLQVDGEYRYSKGDSSKCPSVALMFQIGESATYHNMGGCKEGKDTCTNKSCKGYEVDLMHFSIGNAIPGRLYGGNTVDVGNGGDRFGHLVDLYAWNPHCRYLDGIGPSGNDSSAQNNWKGAWWHSSFSHHSGFVVEDSPYSSDNQKGTYYFEFSRPLRTSDRLQQDAQFSIGGSSKMSAAFWYPVDGKPWHGSGHYSINCDWTSLDFYSSSSKLASSSHGGASGSSASMFALLISVISLCLSILVVYRLFRPPQNVAVEYRVLRPQNVALTSMDNNNL